ncbi:Kinesin-like protein [Wickerhamomyces ciferrii]|uniref:Kinesin-like protein n=1 Tax=Wickerhamomyces ciferrii (strain ATCC 14091 / BCRC 22168 / CBS 111 / JCM 3599 / NBRC 0793 / NRRL Y-1031 F-60-10) TaxID=1206466 RepID=K0KSQ1_WICCF|nr:Kinesin-like protein [Wickerhamomyces ciferrii]CCH44353.1 Kinesin-like protein [Wickerhamomyces ciferrii]
MSNIPHYLRLKPRGDTPEAKEAPYLIESQDETHVKFKETAAANKFTKVFNETSQLDLYKETLQDLTLDTIEGKDSVFFTLGPSNSGKSYSIHGDDANPGLAIYALNEMFNKIGDNLADYKILKKHFGESFVATSNAAKHSTGEYGLTISVFEIYNDRIRDLTQDLSKTVNQSLDIITDAKDGKIKPNKIRQILISNLEEAKVVLHKSIKRRAVSPTYLNQQSSRSHLFMYFNLHKVVGRSVKTSRLTISDLAGSERTKTAKTEGKEFKEGNYTNTSLTELGRCLALMKSKRFERSILRTSKLTRLLLSDLFGNFNQNNKIKILLTLDPYSNLSTILHALRYIQPVSRVTISSERNSIEPESEIVLQLNEELRILKEKFDEVTKENEETKEKLEEQEISIRNELSDEFELKIKEIDANNTEELNKLKESHQRSLDEKLDVLSKDYESKIKTLEIESNTKIEEFKSQIESLNARYQDLESTSNSGESKLLSENQSLLSQLEKLKQELNSSVSDKAQHEIELQNQINNMKENQDKLNSEITVLRKRLEDAEKENKHLQKKTIKKAKKIEELTEKLESSFNNGENDNKRKSEIANDEDTDEDERSPKFARINVESPKKSKPEGLQAAPKIIQNEQDLINFSPIKISTTSPSKKESTSPRKNQTSPFKFGQASPNKHIFFNDTPKKKPLSELNFENKLPEPSLKSPSKSPKKSPKKARKKVTNNNIIENSFNSDID